MATPLGYVLITPARNEAALIEQTIRSVVAQTLPPVKWIIVSDGSTDGTDDIVRGYMARYPWIELERMSERRDRHFAGKAHAFNAGYAKAAGLDYDVIGNLDADLSFEPDLFELLMARFSQDPELGVAGAPFREGGQQYNYRFTSTEHVSGCCQLFRRECFEAIGGYVPVKGGGIDLMAVVTARMNGWRTRVYPERFCVHHRNMNTAAATGVRLWFRSGMKDYRFGNHPAWEIFRCLYQMTKRPFVVGGAVLASGYFWALLSRHERPISNEMRDFIRREQMRRLGRFLRKPLGKQILTERPQPTNAVGERAS